MLLGAMANLLQPYMYSLTMGQAYKQGHCENVLRPRETRDAACSNGHNHIVRTVFRFPGRPLDHWLRSQAPAEARSLWRRWLQVGGN